MCLEHGPRNGVGGEQVFHPERRQRDLRGIVAPPFQGLAAAQVFVDLVIALVLAMIWMWRDARAAGRNPWPWIVATLVTGSFGPLVYLLVRRPPAAARPS